MFFRCRYDPKSTIADQSNSIWSVAWWPALNILIVRKTPQAPPQSDGDGSPPERLIFMDDSLDYIHLSLTHDIFWTAGSVLHCDTDGIQTELPGGRTEMEVLNAEV